MKPLVLLLGFFLFVLILQPAFSGSATWNLNPVNHRWGKAANWTPATVPYGESNVATFGTSNVTDVKLGDTPDGYATNTVAEITFLQDGSAYTITLSPATRTVYSTQLVFYGSGITNNSGVVQNLVATSSLTKDSGQFYFLESSSAGENVVITNEGAVRSSTAGGSTRFWDNSNTGDAIIINEGSPASGTISGGFTALLDFSNAPSATLTSNGGTVSGAAAGYTLISNIPPGRKPGNFDLHCQSGSCAWRRRRLGGNGRRHLRRHQLHRQWRYSGGLPGWPDLCLWC